MIFWRFIASIVVTTALVWQVFVIVSGPVNKSLSLKYIEEAKKSMVLGQLEKSKESLNRAEELSDLNSEVVTELQAQITQIENDLFAARDFYRDNGNENKALVVDAVVKNYETPKEMLQESMQLAQEGEYNYAGILLERAAKIDPAYSGLQSAKEYIEEISKNENI